jgi:hypothetical protein
MNKYKLAYTILIATITLSIYPLLPKIEGALFPVAGKLVIKNPTLTESGNTRFDGEFVKYRKCTRAELEWHFGVQGGHTVLVPSTRPDPIISPEGKASFEGWEVGLTLQQIQKESFVIVFHDCHPFWRTETKFFP